MTHSNSLFKRIEALQLFHPQAERQNNVIIIKTSFYYFTYNSGLLKYVCSKNKWQQINDTFCVLQCSNS